NCKGVVRQRTLPFVKPERRRDRGCDQEQDDENIAELREEAAPRRDRWFCSQLVASDAGEPCRGFTVSKPAMQIGLEGSGDVFCGPPVGVVEKVNHLNERYSCGGSGATNPKAWPGGL